MKTKIQEKTLTMEEILDLSMEYQVPASRVMCGYMRAPRGIKGDTMTGYCSLFERQCSYQVPLLRCDAEQEWLKEKIKKNLDAKVKEPIENVTIPDSWRRG